MRGKARAALAARGIVVEEQAPTATEPTPLLDVRFDEDPVVVLETSKGEIEIRCLAREAPVHVAGFVELARAGHYDGLIWHRVVSNFVIQGGDPRGDGWGGAGYTLRDEISTVRYDRGMVGMPKAGKDTGGRPDLHHPRPDAAPRRQLHDLRAASSPGLEVVDRIEVGDRILHARVE